MSTEWITDRLPTEEDAFMYSVFVMAEPLAYRPDGYVIMRNYQRVLPGDAWQPIQVPAPYVKPKRWKVRWHNELGLWMLTDNDFTQMHLPLLKLGDVDVAWQIANIYNEVMP